MKVAHLLTLGLSFFASHALAADLPSVLVPSVVYSAAGTPLPSASTALKGARAVVSDATTTVFMATYVSGGSTVAPVFCDGSDWLTA